MPYKRTLPENSTFIVLYTENAVYQCQEFPTIRKAVDGYRRLRQLHGDNCRLMKVVVDYGEEI